MQSGFNDALGEWNTITNRWFGESDGVASRDTTIEPKPFAHCRENPS